MAQSVPVWRLRGPAALMITPAGASPDPPVFLETLLRCGYIEHSDPAYPVRGGTDKKRPRAVSQMRPNEVDQLQAVTGRADITDSPCNAALGPKPIAPSA